MRITRLRKRGLTVAVELDGEPWRRLPIEVVALCGLRVGLELDRPTLRRIRTALRRVEALEVAARLLRYRDLSTARLALELGERGVAPVARRETLASVARAGLLDDGRAAASRARVLVDRGHGDAAIRWRLQQEGFPDQAVEDAVTELVPELERARAILERDGTSARSLRALAGRGFAEETLEAVASF
jgi:SOS response regulatory protein OraA/RecX